MIDKVIWMLLSEKNKTDRKMAALAKDFHKKKAEVDINSTEAKAIFRDLEKARGIGAKLITYIDSEYPRSLKRLHYPPAYLYFLGDITLLEHPLKISVVGSREASIYGMNVADGFGMDFAGENIVVVSGGAKGIDSAALRGAMNARGKVIVVLGTGIDITYPSENKALFEKVVQSGGLIISEFRMGMGPFAGNFPIRNRIMAAISDCMVVVEAGERSGAIISADHATELGKTLFAVPGNIDSPTSKGTNSLIRDGALMATSSGDILFELMEKESEKFKAVKNFSFEKSESETEKTVPLPFMEESGEDMGFTRDEKAVLNAIKNGKATYEEIFEYTLMPQKKLTSLLTIMEIKGIIELAFGNRYKILY